MDLFNDPNPEYRQLELFPLGMILICEGAMRTAMRAGYRAAVQHNGRETARARRKMARGTGRDSPADYTLFKRASGVGMRTHFYG